MILDYQEAIKQLRKHFQEKRLIPFIGAGFSIPLGLPSWDSLINRIAESMDFEPDLFKLHGTNIQLAEFIKIRSRKDYKKLIHRMTVEFDSDTAKKRRKENQPHIALSSLDWKTIYTTNYDSHIEGSLQDRGKSVEVLASLEDFLISRNPKACEVIKFHGTLSDPETIILTESQYFDRLELESPVDQRLRSDILSNSFMFVGYSFQDPNIRFIWYKIHKLRREENDEDHAKLRPSYFVTFGVNPIQPELLERWNINIILLDPHDKEKTLADLIYEIGEKE